MSLMNINYDFFDQMLVVGDCEDVGVCCNLQNLVVLSNLNQCDVEEEFYFYFVFYLSFFEIVVDLVCRIYIEFVSFLKFENYKIGQELMIFQYCGVCVLSLMYYLCKKIFCKIL